jgi:hypothetical protein
MAAGQRRHRSLDPTAHHQHRRTPRSSALSEVESASTHLFRYPTEADPAVLVRLGDTEVVGVQPEVHPPGLRRLLRGRGAPLALPCHEGNFDAETGEVHLGATASAAGRIDVEIRGDGMIWASGASV